MAENSKIEWTDHTFNPWRGCSKVSPGCDHCYADTQSKRNPGLLGIWGPENEGGKRIVASEEMWKQPLKWNAAAEKLGVRQRVFCASMADVFEDWQGRILTTETLEEGERGAVAWYRDDIGVCRAGQTTVNHSQGERLATMNDVRSKLFRLIDKTPHLDWLLLTKRPKNVMRMLPPLAVSKVLGAYTAAEVMTRPNVWLGVSVENQAAADERIPILLQIPAAVRFLSCEPLIGPVDLTAHCPPNFQPHLRSDRIGWVIAGGESGHDARPCHRDWIRSLRNQCESALVPFFFKQWGEWVPFSQRSGALAETWTNNNDQRYPECRVSLNPSDESDGTISMHRVGKKLAGRTLDGREWSEFPEVSQ